MRVLVTGASGFIGRALCPALVGAGHSVRAAARDLSRVPGGAGIEPVRLPNLALPVDWSPLLTGIDAVVHLAAIAHEQAGGGPGAEARHDRITHRAAAECAEAAAAVGVRRFVFVSSIRVQAGASSGIVLTEHDPPRPQDPYGRAKLAAEAAIRASGVAHTILRPVVVYGPGVKGNLASLLRLASTPWPLPFGGLDSRRSLLALDNLTSAIAFALADSSTVGETYIVADDDALTLPELIASVRAAQGRPARLFAVPRSLLSFALRLLGRPDIWERLAGPLVVDTAKLHAAGWMPVVDTTAALAAMAQAPGRKNS